MFKLFYGVYFIRSVITFGGLDKVIRLRYVRASPPALNVVDVHYIIYNQRNSKVARIVYFIIEMDHKFVYLLHWHRLDDDKELTATIVTLLQFDLGNSL